MKLEGILPVIPTPFKTEGQIDIESFKRLLDLAIHEGVSGVCLFAAGAEFYKLSWEEKTELFEIAINHCKDRILVVATVSNHGTYHAIQEREYYEKRGADAINLMPPSFAAPSGTMIASHVIDVAKDAVVPLIIQYAPALLGFDLDREFFEKVGKSINDIYIKLEADPVGPVITSLIKTMGNDVKIITGNGGINMLESFQRGSCAVMPGVATLLPYVKIYEKFKSIGYEGAIDLYNKFLPHMQFIQRDIECFVAMEKIILYKRGIIDNPMCRKPYNYPDELTKEILLQSYKEIKKIFYS